MKNQINPKFILIKMI